MKILLDSYYNVPSRIMSSFSDNKYDSAIKIKGVTYYIQMLDNSQTIATWWDSANNAIGHSNRGYIYFDPKGVDRSRINSKNIAKYLVVDSDMGVKLNSSVEKALKKEVAHLYSN